MRRVKPNLTELLQQASTSSFRLYLQSELARRCTANPQYSLRSFAMQLEISHSTLSQLLRGKRALTARTINAVGQRLGLNPAEISAFIARERLNSSPATVASREIRDLTLDTIALLSDSSHRALLELTTLPEFQPDSRWIARTLDISVDDVNRALSRLTRLRLLEMVEPNRWLDRTGMPADSPQATEDAFAQVVIRRLSEQVRQLSFKEVPQEPAEFSEEAATTTIVMSAAQLPALLAVLARLQRESVQQADDAQQYQLELNLKLLNPTS